MKSKSSSRPILHIQLRYTSALREAGIECLSWSPDGNILASGGDENIIRFWNAKSGEVLHAQDEHNNSIRSVAWSPDGRALASGGNDSNVFLWDALTGKPVGIIRAHSYWILSIDWSSDGKLLSFGAYDRTVQVWNVHQLERQWVGEHNSPVLRVAWSPDGQNLASGAEDGIIKLWEAKTGDVTHVLDGHGHPIRSLLWSPDGGTLASGSTDSTIRLWDTKLGILRHKLEGHRSSISELTWLQNGNLLASMSEDGGIRVWRCDTWETVKIYEVPEAKYVPRNISFHPIASIQTSFGVDEVNVHKWDIDINDLLNATPTFATVHYTSAKIVLVGESNVGKSCLALRLAEDRYEEQGSTHGMRIWTMTPEQLNPETLTPPGEKRDIVLWDMGGQDEYRLVHQLFIHDTTLALILMDPTRGRTAFEEVEGWNLRLEKQLHGRETVKLLVGTKLDVENFTIDRARLLKLVSDCGIAKYYQTSARNGRGLPELRHAISKALNWEMLAKTSRPALFQRIRDEIQVRQQNGELVLLFSELLKQLFTDDPDDYDVKSVNAVVDQLAIQGVITDTRLGSGERVLVLQIAEVERYAGSLIIAARNNPRGVPAIEEQTITSGKMTFPGIPEEERLHPFAERIVLECVVQLMLEHGICLRHERLLIFPYLFQPSEKSQERNVHHSISLYYDFSGAIGNIYSSLVVWIAISERFGRVRLWENQAEFENAEREICGLRKVDRQTGLAHLDLYFSNETSNETRDLFTIFVEEHLRKEGVSITEVLEVTCGCGYRFQESSLRKRYNSGKSDIVCPECENRNRISEGAKRVRAGNPVMNKNLLALKTIINEKNQEAIDAIRLSFHEARGAIHTTEPVRILHLSDLHIGSDSHPLSMLQPLVRDLNDQKGGLGFRHLDYLVISGDLTNRATAEEFELARRFISELIDRFRLSAERCIIVPGNHDLSWEQEVYVWKPERKVNLSGLNKGSYKKKGDVFLIRDENKYPSRFENFAKFYHSLTQEQYPLEVEDQCMPFLFEDTMIQFIAMNSAWEIDEFFKSRASINERALSKGLMRADEQINKAKEDGRLQDGANVLRIAVWHHPVTGNEKISKDAFLERLRQEDVHLCLHGHVHEDRADVVGYHHRRQIHIAGAGSFGAPVKDRPEAVPRLYNVLEVEREHSRIRVHTRCLRKDGGAWEGWAVWPSLSKNANERLTFYNIEHLGFGY